MVAGWESKWTLKEIYQLILGINAPEFEFKEEMDIEGLKRCLRQLGSNWSDAVEENNFLKVEKFRMESALKTIQEMIDGNNVNPLLEDIYITVNWGLGLED